MNLKQDFRLLAIIQIFVGLFMGVPTILAWVYKEDAAFYSFSIAMLVILGWSLVILWFCRGRTSDHMSPVDSFLFVTLTWVLATAFGALPLYLSGTMHSYSDAYFEIMSGFTTTGATALPSIEDKARSILFWRSETNWLGGMGIVVLFVAILPMLGVKGTMLYGSESAGPTKDKLTPKTGGTAGALWTIYIGLSALQVVVLLCCKLPLYEAVTVTFSTMSAAGFCVKNASIGAFQSPAVEVVVTIFMFLSGVNFALYFKMLSGRFKSAIHDGELKTYTNIVLGTSLLIALNLALSGTVPGILSALRCAFFHVVSIITTTGFMTVDYTRWPMFSQMLLFMLFFVGGCAGSAGGGIKVIRVAAILNLAKDSIHRRLHPNSVIRTRVGRDVMDQDVLLGISGFIGLYIATGLVGAIIVSLAGFDFVTTFSASFLTLGNIGLGFGSVGPSGNFSIFPAWCQWVFSFLMLVGRLELVTVFALFSSSFWRDQSAYLDSRRERIRVERKKQALKEKAGTKPEDGGKE